MMLSEHFSLAEFTVTQQRGLDNTPPPALIPALVDTAERMERVRALLGHPIIVTSGYRSPAVNAAVGGSKTSAHIGGRAVDFICPGFGSPSKVCKVIAAPDVAFDQIIAEGNWVHISFEPRKPMRRMLLTAHFGPGGTSYTDGFA